MAVRQSQQLDLHAMSVDELVALDALVLESIQDRKKRLEAKLALINSHVVQAATPRRRRGVKKGTRLRAKYVGPNGETWSGRGLRPRWLSELMALGHKPERYLLG